MSSFKLNDVASPINVQELGLELTRMYQDYDSKGHYDLSPTSVLDRTVYESAQVSYLKTMSIENIKKILVVLKYLKNNNIPLNDETIKILEARSALKGSDLPKTFSSYPVKAKKMEGLPNYEEQVTAHFGGSPIPEYVAWMNSVREVVKVPLAGSAPPPKIAFKKSGQLATVQINDKPTPYWWPVSNTIISGDQATAFITKCAAATIVPTNKVKCLNLCSPWGQLPPNEWEAVLRAFGVSRVYVTTKRNSVSVFSDADKTSPYNGPPESVASCEGQAALIASNVIMTGLWKGASKIMVQDGRMFSYVPKGSATHQVSELSVKSMLAVFLALGGQIKGTVLGYKYVLTPQKISNTIGAMTKISSTYRKISGKNFTIIFRSGTDAGVYHDPKSVKKVKVPKTVSTPVDDITGLLDELNIGTESVLKVLGLQSCINCK
jgi:hypothetical protein